MADSHNGLYSQDKLHHQKFMKNESQEKTSESLKRLFASPVTDCTLTIPKNCQTKSLEAQNPTTIHNNS